jgi:hypothetical protein
MQRDRDRVEAVVLAVVRELGGAKSLHEDLECLVEALAAAVPVDAEEPDLDR